jgi:DNA-binding transcriptional LysR family regulator
MAVNLKLIATFLSVAQHSSFRKAAEELNRSLPAVSMQIKQLEEQLGLPLFQRTTRKVELTRDGVQLLISARRAIAELDGGLTRLQLSAEIQQGHLPIACVPTVSSTRLPKILTAYARKHPGVTVHVRELAQNALVDAVRHREVDFAIGASVERHRELDFAPIFNDDYYALLPRGSRTGARSSAIALRELAKMPLLKLHGATAFRDHIERAMEAAGLAFESNYEFMHAHTMIAMAEAGLGVAVLPGVGIPSGTRLKAVRIVEPRLSRTIGVLTVRGHRLSPAARRFVELCTRMIHTASSR